MSVSLQRLPNGLNVNLSVMAGEVFYLRYAFTNTTGQAIKVTYDETFFNNILDTNTDVAQPAPGAAPGNWLATALSGINLNGFLLTNLGPPIGWNISNGQTATFDIGVRGVALGMLNDANWTPTTFVWQPVLGGASTPIVLTSSPTVTITEEFRYNRLVNSSTANFATNAGIDFALNYRFENLDLSRQARVTFSEQNWGILRVTNTPGVSLNWAVVGNQSVAVNNDTFQLTNADPLEWIVAPNTSATFTVTVEGVMMGTLLYANWAPTITVLKEDTNTDWTLSVLATKENVGPNITINNDICVHEDTLVKTQSGVKRISKIEAGERCYDASGQLKRVERNVCSGVAKKYVRIQHNALGKNQPSNDLLIARGHPLLLNGKEVPCEELIDGHMVQEIELEKAARLFTLVTEGRGFVEMQGLLVGTWSHASLENFQQNDGLGTMLRLDEQ